MSDNKDKENQEQQEAQQMETEKPATEAADSSAAPAQEEAATAAPKPSRAPVVLALLALVGVLGLGAAGYGYWQRMQQSLSELTQAAAELGNRQEEIQTRLKGTEGALAERKEAIETLNRSFDAQKSLIDTERDRLQQREAAMKAELEAVHRRIGRSSSQWMAAEAEYLMRVANHRLLLERDVNTALSALQAADGRLKATMDPGWTAAREALAGEMAALHALAKVDTIGMAASLSSLASRVETLPLVGSRPLVFTGEGSGGASEGEEQGLSVRKILQDGWNGFRSMMVVRRLDEPVTAMLPPEQHYFVHQNLRLQLEAARFALLRHDRDLYRSSLETAASWIREFVVAEDAEAQVMLEEIGRLAKVDITPELPDISGSLRLLREQMENAAMESPAP